MDSREEGLITKELCEILDVTGIHCEKKLSSIVQATQKVWLRPFGKERWELEDSLKPSSQIKVVQLCQKMGLFSEIAPQKKYYRYCCVLGENMPVVHSRFEYMAQLWERGVRFQELVFLTGDRTLDPRIDRLPSFVELPKNETEGMLQVFETLDLPKELKQLPLTVIDAPKQLTDLGLHRPTTADTIRCWLEKSPKNESCLFVSSQPYVQYQNAVARNLMPKGFVFETVGPSCDEGHEKAIVLLDTIARWLYQESLNRNCALG